MTTEPDTDTPDARVVILGTEIPRLRLGHLARQIIDGNAETITRRDHAAIRFAAVCPPQRFDVLKAEVDRRRDVMELAHIETPYFIDDPTVSALESVITDIRSGRLA